MTDVHVPPPPPVDRPPPDLSGRTVILVDDGLATGVPLITADAVGAVSAMETAPPAYELIYAFASWETPASPVYAMSCAL